jgi:hypothetical protein
VNSTLLQDVDTNHVVHCRAHCPQIVAMFRSFAMRAKVWLVVVCIGLVAYHLTVVPAEGRPPVTAPFAESAHEDAVVIETPPNAPPPKPVKVRVYTSPDVANDVLQSALNVAEATFAAASLQIVWKVCGPSECNTPPSPAERLVRLVRTPPGGTLDSRCLGDAMIDMEKGVGVLATVYVDRVLALVQNLELDYRTVLGRTIAHELGHLLLATNTHSASGLMRELWSPEELQASRAADWLLRPVDVAAIRQRLTLSRAGRSRGMT